jgi:hypothetical protein
MNGIFVAITVIVATFASSGKPAMYRTALPTSSTSINGSARTVPSAWAAPDAAPLPMSVAALPISIWPQAMSNARPSSAVDFVRPVMACLVAV